MKRNDEAAEKIIKSEGLAFALASKIGSEDDLREARTYLKSAIAKALDAEFSRGQSAAMAGDID